jgi:pimeloyl-ACP methyl ester carboxylesterase
MAKNNLYLFSGLGADERVFHNLQFPNSKIHFIKWPAVPANMGRDEFLNSIAAQITTRRNNVFVGVSFGGMVAQDMAGLIPVESLIIISSVLDPSEMPALYRGAIGRLGLWLLPQWILNKPNFVLDYFFSIRTQSGRRALADIIRDTDPTFVRWAMRYAQQWQKPDLAVVKKIHRLHGDADRIFPKAFHENTNRTLKGGHFIVYEAASEINGFLKAWL